MWLKITLIRIPRLLAVGDHHSIELNKGHPSQIHDILTCKNIVQNLTLLSGCYFEICNGLDEGGI